MCGYVIFKCEIVSLSLNIFESVIECVCMSIWGCMQVWYMSECVCLWFLCVKLFVSLRMYESLICEWMSVCPSVCVCLCVIFVCESACLDEHVCECDMWLCVCDFCVWEYMSLWVFKRMWYVIVCVIFECECVSLWMYEIVICNWMCVCVCDFYVWVCVFLSEDVW